MKLASFDIEIAKPLPEGETDWHAHRPLGISCAMIHTGDITTTYDGRHHGNGRLPVDTCRRIIEDLQSLVRDGYTIVTVNGLAFDFDILAEESGWRNMCARLAVHHCDLLFMSVCQLGWRVGLDALCEGAGVESKLHNVTLSTGETISDMSGARAPELWAAGEYDAVMAYLRRDVEATLEVAQTAVSRRALGWHSSKGRWWEVALVNGRLPTVAECMTWPLPDTSWMTDPPSRQEMLAWTWVE